MRRLRITVVALFAALMLFLPMGTGECYITLKYKDVPFTFGKVSLPEDMTIVEFDFASFLKKMEENKTLKGELAAMDGQGQYKKLLEILDKPEVKEMLNSLRLYQGGLYDGKSYRSVWFLTVTENKYLNDFYGDFFKSKLTEEKVNAVTGKINILHKFAQSYKLQDGEVLDYSEVKKMTSKNQSDRAVFEVLDISEPQVAKRNGKQALVMDYRLAGQMMGSFSAFYVKNYSFGYKNKPASLVVLTLDSERFFWQEIFDKALLDEKKAGEEA